MISDNVNAYDYDSATGVLTLRFNDGSLYQYYGVPQSFADEFSYPHPWHRVHDRIKAYGYQRVA